MNYSEMVNMITEGVRRAIQMNKSSNTTQENYMHNTAILSKENDTMKQQLLDLQT